MDPAEPAHPARPDRPAGALGPPGPNGDGPRHGSNGEAAAGAAAAEDAAEPEYTCPNCSVTFAVPSEPADRVLECPACRAQFFVPAGDDDGPGDGDADEPESRDPAADFDHNHVEQVKAVRRGLYKTRNYVMVGVFALAGTAFELVFVALRHAYYGTWGPRPTGYVVAAVGCVIGAVLLRRRARDVDRELDETALPEPATEPDLSTLSDGSQFIETVGKNLERMRRRRDPPVEETDEGTAHE